MTTRLVLHEPSQGTFRRLDARRFAKDFIPVGKWVLKDGRVLDVTPERMDAWVSKFNAMKAAGIRVDFPVDHSADSRDNMGFVETMERNGNVLRGVVDVPKEEDAGRTGSTIREVSISVHPDYADGSGKRWGEVICHVAPCTRPVVHGQSNFVPLAARGEPQVEIYTCRKDVTHMELRKEVADLLKLDEDKAGSDDKVAAALRERFEQHAQNIRKTKDERDGALTRIAALDVEVKDLRSKVPEDKKDSPEVVEMRKRLDRIVADGADARVAQLRAEGKITPAMEPGVRALLAQREIALRVADKESDVAAQVDAVFASLPKGAALDLTERTKKFAETPKPGEPPDEKQLRQSGVAAAERAQGREPGK